MNRCKTVDLTENLFRTIRSLLNLLRHHLVSPQQQGRAVFLQSAAPRPVLREHPQHLGVESRRVVHLLPVAQLMDHHAVDDLRRRQHQETIEAEVPPAGAAAPPGLLTADGNSAIVHPHFGGVVPHPLRDVPPSLLRQSLQLRLGQRGKFRRLLLLPLQLFLVLSDPLPVLPHKIFDLPVCGPEGRTDNQPLWPELQPQGLSPAADQFVGDLFHIASCLRAHSNISPIGGVLFHDHSAKTLICK